MEFVGIVPEHMAVVMRFMPNGSLQGLLYARGGGLGAGLGAGGLAGGLAGRRAQSLGPGGGGPSRSLSSGGASAALALPPPVPRPLERDACVVKTPPPLSLLCLAGFSELVYREGERQKHGNALDYVCASLVARGLEHMAVHMAVSRPRPSGAHVVAVAIGGRGGSGLGAGLFLVLSRCAWPSKPPKACATSTRRA